MAIKKRHKRNRKFDSEKVMIDVWSAQYEKKLCVVIVVLWALIKEITKAEHEICEIYRHETRTL